MKNYAPQLCLKQKFEENYFFTKTNKSYKSVT